MERLETDLGSLKKIKDQRKELEWKFLSSKTFTEQMTIADELGRLSEEEDAIKRGAKS